MAQAQDQEESRKTQTYKDFKAMNTQDERYGIEKEEFFWLENIQPIGPHKLASIPGPGATFVTIPGGGSRHILQMFPLNIRLGPFFLVMTDDGTVWAIDVVQTSITQINGSVTFFNFTTSVWQGTTGLIVDPVSGYYAWPLLPDASIAAIGAAGNVDVGNHTWKITFVASGNEGGLGTATATLNVTPASHVSLTVIPKGPTGTTARKVYRNKVADQTHWFLVGTIADNTTTTFDDNVADSGLGAQTSTLGQMLPVDATKAGSAIESFSGRVWIGNGRTTSYTAPNTFSDFDPAHAAGNFIMTDSAFVGDIKAFLSSLDVLWIFGEAAVNQLSNVVVPPSTTTTTFSNVNISSSVGTVFPRSIISFLRQIMFSSKYGVIQQIGVTPQRVSDKIDGTFQRFDLTKPISGALFILNDVLCYGVMATYNDPDSGSQRKVIICFTQDGKWFVASQGDTLSWMASVETGGLYRTFGTDGLIVKELFTTAGYSVHKLKSPLYDFGDVAAGVEFHRLMAVMEFPVATLVNTTLTPQTQQSAKTPLVSSKSNQLIFVGLGPIQFVNNSNVNLNFVGKGYVLEIWSVNLNDKMVGFDLSFDSDPFYFLGYAIDYQIRESWGDVRQ